MKTIHWHFKDYAGLLSHDANHLLVERLALDNTSITHKYYSVADLPKTDIYEGDFVVVFSMAALRTLLDNHGLKDTDVVQLGGVNFMGLHDFGFAHANEHYWEVMTLNLRKALFEWITGQDIQKETTYTLITDQTLMEEVVAEIKAFGRVCFDFETDGLHHYAKPGTPKRLTKVRLLALSYVHGHSYLLPLDDPYFDHDLVAQYKLFGYFAENVFNNPAITKVNHNIKYDMHVAEVLGHGAFAGAVHDTMVLAHMVFQADGRRWGLKPLLESILPTVGSYKGGLDDSVAVASMETLMPYAAKDTDGTLQLYDVFIGNILHHNRQYINLFRNLLAPVTYMTYDMERNGMQVDNPYRLSMVEKAETLIAAREKRMLENPAFIRYDAGRREDIKKLELERLNTKVADLLATGKHLKKTGEESIRYQKYNNDVAALLTNGVEHIPTFSFTSPAQMGDFFYTSPHGLKYDLPFVRANKSDQSKGIRGDYKSSTASENLMLLKDKTGIISDLEAHREMNKMVSTYLHGFEVCLDPQEKLHPSFGQTRTETGRLGGGNPNPQNLPSHSKVGEEDTSEIAKAVKSMIVAPPGYKMAQFDFKALELRVMAYLSQDPNLLKVFSDNVDPHRQTAIGTSDLTEEQYDALPKDKAKQLRNKGKATNFQLIYYVSVPGFVYNTKIMYGIELTKKEAEEICRRYFETYPGVHDYHKRQIAFVKKHGYVETLLGRRRSLNNIYSPMSDKQEHAIRQAINTPSQGAGAEVAQFVQVLIRNRMQQLAVPEDVIWFNQVHDSMMCYIKPELLPVLYRELNSILVDINETLKIYFDGRHFKNVNLEVDAEVSDTSWQALTHYEPETV